LGESPHRAPHPTNEPTPQFVWWQITFDLAKRYEKRVGFRIMLENRDAPEPGMPEFLMERVPYVKLKRPLLSANDFQANPETGNIRHNASVVSLGSVALTQFAV
jgi:hypothetical protein